MVLSFSGLIYCVERKVLVEKVHTRYKSPAVSYAKGDIVIILTLE